MPKIKNILLIEYIIQKLNFCLKLFKKLDAWIYPYYFNLDTLRFFPFYTYQQLLEIQECFKCTSRCPT